MRNRTSAILMALLLAVVAASAVLLAAFVAIERRSGRPLVPPHTWKIESIVKHKHQKAAYCGLTFFDSDAYPPEYRGKLYMGNIHGNCINVDELTRDGSTYFRISTLPQYGRLVKLDREGMKDGARVDVVRRGKGDVSAFE